jgi:hypothetical protein
MIFYPDGGHPFGSGGAEAAFEITERAVSLRHVIDHGFLVKIAETRVGGMIKLQ